MLGFGIESVIERGVQNTRRPRPNVEGEHSAVANDILLVRIMFLILV